ncbi:MAG: hypothetical protein U9Q20_06050 [Campylobacterota bacterium]|nr:hypothetical protein [Campylobacterota bacterium]
MQLDKQNLKDIISKEIDEMEIDSVHLCKETLTVKLNTIIKNTIKKIKLEKNISVPMYKTTNENVFDGVSFDNEKTSDVDFSDFNDQVEPIKKIQNNDPKSIPSNFMLTYELREYAKLKFVKNVDEMFDDFKLYYQSKGTMNSDWEAVWKRWVLNNNKYKNHLIKTTIKDDMILTTSMKKFAKKFIDNENTNLEFLKFKNHYLGTGDLKVSWEKVWENWCIQHKQFKPKEQSIKQKQKQEYRWDFRKAKEVSDRIKDWLEFEKNINWLNDFYLKDIPIPGIGWQEVQHPDFNKEEILLYKIDSVDGNFMIEHKSDDIIDAEVLEND